VVTASSFNGNESGLVALNDSDPYIRGSELLNNYVGLWCASGSEPDAGTVSDFGNNSVVGTTNKHVANFTDDFTLPAVGNWWGQYPPSSKKFQNAVDYMPALAAPPGAMMSTTSPPVDVAPSIQSGFVSVMPNPFNPEIGIAYGVRSPANASLAIFNVQGQLITILFDEAKAAGRHVVRWDGTDRSGRPVASGVYFARLTVGGVVQTRKLVLLK
jgi:hypothetical protein